MRDLSERAIKALATLEQGQADPVVAGTGWFWLGEALGVGEARELEAKGLVTTRWLNHTPGWDPPGTMRLAVKLISK